MKNGYFKTARTNLKKNYPDTGIKFSRYIVHFIIAVYEVIAVFSFFAL
jgi:hypothetical protein